MGVTRYGDLPENVAVRRLQDARQVSRERKGSNQRTGGSNIAFFVSASDDTYDWIGLVDGPTGNPDYGLAQFVVTLTASVAIVPLIDVALVVYYSPDGITYTEYTEEDSSSDAWNMTAPEMGFGIEPLTGVTNPAHELQFRAGLNARMNTRAAFKLQAVGSDEVEISVTRVS